jgi:hypothetical protein
MQAFQQVMLANQAFYDKSSYDKSKVDPNHIPPTIEVSISVIHDTHTYVTLLIDRIVPTYIVQHPSASFQTSTRNASFSES